MPDRYVETAGLVLEIDTKDSTLPTHSARKIYYVEPGADGLPGNLPDAKNVAGAAVAGLDGDSVMQGTAITLIKGVYRYWAESTTPAGIPCVSPAFEVIVEIRGTVRR